MEVFAISAKYPTLLQTWFINYLEGLEQSGHTVKVGSLYDEENPCHPKVFTLKARAEWKGQPFKALLKGSTLYLLKNLLNRATYRYIYNCFKYSASVKEAVKSLLYISVLSIESYDVAHCHSDKAGYLLLPALKTYGKPIIATFHGLPPEGIADLTQAARKQYFNAVDMIVVNTDFARKQLIEITHTATPIKVINQGINIEEFPFYPAIAPDDHHFTVSTVGRLDRLKGHLYAIDAIESLNKVGFNVDYQIIGAGLYKDKIESYIKSRNLGAFVKVIGPLTGPRLIKFLASTQVVLLPSFTEPGAWAETQGIVLQEAQALGKLVIASRSGGIPECIIHGHTGFLVEPQSSESLELTIKYVFKNTAQWRTWQSNARHDVEKRFSLESMSQSLIDMYSHLIGKSS
ncbi:glycosyltransferase family 4 protein [Marinimicrobium sp. ARAG 43.8]|uniref:glycosyltransferase family 4 protein n=1 Tax=Marinimicrobium sp. ARAG 43.8 TaxID=3418719 RepID=UPI003CF45275